MPDEDETQTAIAELAAAGAKEWPAWITHVQFVVRLEELWDGSEVPTESRALHAGDLYLATAAMAGVEAACATLGKQIRDLAAVLVGRMGGDSAAADETASAVIEKLLVGSPARAARIADYRGRGTLAGWLRATVARTFLNAKRKNKREVLIGNDAVLDALDNGHVDPVLAHVKSQYRDEFALAFEAAIAALTDRQRGVLGYRFVDGASVDTIAAVYRIHRATAHRWISDARAALAFAIERALGQRLAASDLDINSIRALVESQLELSLSRMFAV